MRSFAFVLLIFIGSLFISACSKIDDQTEMNITIGPSATAYNIPIITSLDTSQIIAIIPVNLNLDSMIRIQNKRFASTNIKNIRLNSLELNITDTAANVTFDNFENIRMTIQGNGESSNLLASSNPSDSKVKTLNIPVTATVNDLKTLVKGGTINYVLRGKLRRATTKIYAITATTTFRVALEL
ncbi:MAG: hypothetical protein H7223_04135 [Pedobacter sp.]|nr:hypothetical protein [Pedobacter sp.]